MSTLLPRIRAKYGEGIGIELFVAFPDLSGYEKTYFDTDEAASQTTLSANGTNFSVGEYIVLGIPMNEGAEIRRIHAATAPTSTSIVITSGTTYAHSRGEIIQFLPYNQIVVERSTDSGSTWTPLTAINIRPDASETYIPRPSDASTDYYRFRFYNSSDSTYSAYSDQIVATGLTAGTVGQVKRRALLDMGEELGNVITDEFLNESLNEARREVDQDPRVGKWSFRTSFNTDIGDIISGRWSVACPTTLRDRNTYKNILGIRLGRDGSKLEYLDFNRLMERYTNVAHTTLSAQCASGATTASLTSSGDFDESGTIYFAAESVAGTLDSATYTANDESTNTLSGVTGVTDTHASGRDVWQGTGFGYPAYYTVNNGYVYFNIPFDDSIAGENIYMDFYIALTDINSDADTFDEPEYDLYVNYLKWKIKYRKSNGTLKAEEDGDYKEFKRKKDDLVSKEISGQDIRLVIDDWYQAQRVTRM